MSLEHNNDAPAPMKFRPLTDGLGINHFADGSPYAGPNAKNQTAGKVITSVTRKASVAPRSNLAEDTSAPKLASSNQTLKTPVFSSVVANSNLNSSRVASDRVAARQEEEFGLGPFTPASGIKRCLSFFADIFFVTLGFGFIVWLGFYLNGTNFSTLAAMVSAPGPDLSSASSGLLMPFLLLYFVISVGYFLVQEVTWHRTLGKALFGLRIEAKSTMSILGRMFFFLIAALPLGLGFFWYFFNPRRRCWHDVVSDSDVLSY